jgi:hypothetical protein
MTQIGLYSWDARHTSPYSVFPVEKGVLASILSGLTLKHHPLDLYFLVVRDTGLSQKCLIYPVFFMTESMEISKVVLQPGYML